MRFFASVLYARTGVFFLPYISALLAFFLKRFEHLRAFFMGISLFAFRRAHLPPAEPPAIMAAFCACFEAGENVFFRHAWQYIVYLPQIGGCFSRFITHWFPQIGGSGILSSVQLPPKWGKIRRSLPPKWGSQKALKYLCFGVYGGLACQSVRNS